MQWKIISLFLAAGVCLAAVELPMVNSKKVDRISQTQQEEAPGSFDKEKLIYYGTADCFEDAISPIVIKSELNEAKNTRLTHDFTNACDRNEEYISCVTKRYNAVTLKETKKPPLDQIKHFFKALLDYYCFIVSVAEDENNCINFRPKNLLDCIEATWKISVDFPSDLLSLFNSMKHNSTQECEYYFKFRHCIVADLENNLCQNTNAANEVDYIFEVLGSSTCQSSEPNRKKIYTRAKRHIQWQTSKMLDFPPVHNKVAEKCKENGGKQAVKDFWDSLYTAQACFGKNRIFVTPRNEYLLSLKNCTSDWILKAEACLSEDSKYYPSLFMETAESLIEFVYDHLNFNTLSPRSEIVNCLQKIKRVGIKGTLGFCTQFESPPEYSRHYIPNKTDTCKQWSNVNECFNNFVKTTCIRDIDIDRFLANLTTAIQKPCRNILSTLS